MRLTTSGKGLFRARPHAGPFGQVGAQRQTSGSPPHEGSRTLRRQTSVGRTAAGGRLLLLAARVARAARVAALAVGRPRLLGGGALLIGFRACSPAAWARAPLPPRRHGPTARGAPRAGAKAGAPPLHRPPP